MQAGLKGVKEKDLKGLKVEQTKDITSMISVFDTLSTFHHAIEMKNITDIHHRPVQ